MDPHLSLSPWGQQQRADSSGVNMWETNKRGLATRSNEQTVHLIIQVYVDVQWCKVPWPSSHLLVKDIISSCVQKSERYRYKHECSCQNCQSNGWQAQKSSVRKSYCGQYTQEHNIKNSFIILSCTHPPHPLCPQNSLNSSEHGLYKVSKAFHRDAGPSWLQCFPQVVSSCLDVLFIHTGNCWALQNPAALQFLTQTSAPGTYYHTQFKGT